jgi:hypothetical protein
MIPLPGKIEEAAALLNAGELAPRGVRARHRRALGQPVRPDQPDARGRRARGARPARRTRAGRRGLRRGPRIDDRRLPRPLELVEPASLARAVEAALAQGGRVAVLARSAPPAQSARVVWKRMPGEAGPYGRALYAALRALDGAGAARILAETVPAGEAWAAASDRLARAAARGDSAGGGLSEST